MKKNINTDLLLEQLKRHTNIDTYINTYEDVLIKKQFSSYLNEVADIKNMTKADVSQKTQLSKSYIYKIFSGEKLPSKDKLLQLCFALSVTLDEAQKLLKQAGYSELYCKSKRESIIIFSFNNGLSIYEANDLLVNKKEKPLFDLY